MNQNAGKHCKPAQPLTKREQKILNSGGGCPAVRRRLERKAAGLVAEVTPAARPQDEREFRNLSDDDYRKSNHLLGSIAGFADLLGTL